MILTLPVSLHGGDGISLVGRNLEKSGGIVTNIGVHFFDMLTWIFGPVTQNIVPLRQADTAACFLGLAHEQVRWFLSVNDTFLPEETVKNGQRTFRSIRVDGIELEFSGVITDLNTRSYVIILFGQGFGLEEARASIHVVYNIRNRF